jgi:hypothetical protein
MTVVKLVIERNPYGGFELILKLSDNAGVGITIAKTYTQYNDAATAATAAIREWCK